MRRGIIALSVPLITGAALLVAAQTAFAGGGCHQGATQGVGTSVDLTGMCFSPTILYVQPGAIVTWSNRDSMRHEVVGTGWSRGPSTLEDGQTISQTFPAGRCWASSMSGWTAGLCPATVMYPMTANRWSR